MGYFNMKVNFTLSESLVFARIWLLNVIGNFCSTETYLIKPTSNLSAYIEFCTDAYIIEYIFLSSYSN